MNRNRASDILAGYELARREQGIKLPERRGCSGCLILPWWVLPIVCTLCALGEMIYRATQGYFR